MYPAIPPPATGRASLEWFQVVAMRYRDASLEPFGEPADVWDKLRNPDVDVFLTKEDYHKILTALENNLRSKGAGRHNVNPSARCSDDGSARSSVDPNPSSHNIEMTVDDECIWDIAHAHAADMLTWDINSPPTTAPPPYNIPNVHAYCCIP